MAFCSSRSIVFRERGFTLIELLLVLAIISIGLAVALPSIQSITKRQRVNRTALVVAADIRSAFTSAARGRVPVEINISGDTSGYAIVNRVTGETIVARHFGDGAVSIASMTGEPITLNVYPNGVAARSDTVLIQTTTASPRVVRMISISRIGFVRVLP